MSEREPCECEGWKIGRPYWMNHDDVKFQHDYQEWIHCPWCGSELKVKEEERFQWLAHNCHIGPGGRDAYPIVVSPLLTEKEANEQYGPRLIKRVDESWEGKG